MAHYVKSSDLKASGWSQAQIKLLGRPHKTITVGTYFGKDGFQSRIYANAWLRTTVESVHASVEWMIIENRKRKRTAVSEEAT